MKIKDVEITKEKEGYILWVKDSQTYYSDCMALTEEEVLTIKDILNAMFPMKIV